MSLRHGLLGLLAEGPASGYDLTRRFEETFAQVWPAQHPKIYSELNRLAVEGLIEVDSRGPRGRKAYRITDAGLAAIRTWLADGEVDHTLRSESILRAAFFWLMEPGELQAHLDRERRYYTEAAAFYRDLTAAKDRGDFGDTPQTRALRVAAEAGVRFFQAMADWATWAADRPAPSAQPAEPAEPAEPA
jgi:DNA-binding PadR family transcriptional regulator